MAISLPASRQSSSLPAAPSLPAAAHGALLLPRRLLQEDVAGVPGRCRRVGAGATPVRRRRGCPTAGKRRPGRRRGGGAAAASSALSSPRSGRSEQICGKEKNTTTGGARARLLSLSPPIPRCRHHHPRRQLPASSGAAQHAHKLRTVRTSLPSGQILRSWPLPPARNPIPMARVSGRASPTRLRRPQMHAMGVPHPPRSSPSRSPSRRYEGRHGPSAPQGQQGGTLSSSTSSPRMTPLLHQDRASNPHLLSISPISTSPVFNYSFTIINTILI